mmetsp:Transcript_24492/g.77431  ORF Transcript_24492/g.77431 Transcript_24492/m.77431 type:complete len:215 (+) Transcript_24492:373-1017(+)
MVAVHANGYLEALVGQAEVADPDRDLPDVVPHVRHVVVAGRRQRALEAVERHVVLAGVEAAQPQVTPQLCVVDPHLQQPPVESQRYFRLVGVEVVARQARDGLDVGGVEEEALLIETHSLGHVVERIVYASCAQDQRRRTRVLLNPLHVVLECGVGLVKADVHLAQLADSRHHGLVPDAAQELLLCLTVQPELVVALPQPRLPPPVLVVRLDRR